MSRDSSPPPHRIAVVGAGIAGLACARELVRAGREVRVFEKSRGVGGRMATRRAGELRFDHGAQYFVVRDDRFAARVEALRASGAAALWPGRFERLRRDGRAEPAGSTNERLVGTPGMSSLCRGLAEGLDVRFSARVEAVRRESGRWWVTTAGRKDSGPFDALVVTAPAPQAAELLAEAAPALAERVAEVAYDPCWAGMVAFAEPLPVPLDGAFVDGPVLSWAARDGTKPGRAGRETWVLHATHPWSREHLELDRDEVAPRLVAAFGEALAVPLPEPVHLDAHRWRYALPRNVLGEPCLHDPERAVAVAGDGCGGPRVEGAFLSGLAAARLLGSRAETDGR